MENNQDMRVTIGVPVYKPNMAYLKDCLESIKGQTYKNYEVVVLQDGGEGREETENMAKEYGFKYLYQENTGIGGARNAIIDKMSDDSDYLYYLSCDDIMHQDCLRVMCETAKQHDGCILFSDFLLINENGQVIMENHVPEFETFEDFCVACLVHAERDTMFVNFSSTFFPADVIKKERFDADFTYGEDLEFVLRTALVNKRRYVHVSQLLVKIRMHAGSVTTIKKNDIPRNNAKIFDKIGGLLGW